MSANDTSGSNNLLQKEGSKYQCLQTVPPPIGVLQTFDKTQGTIFDDLPSPKFFPQLPQQLNNKVTAPVQNSPEKVRNDNLELTVNQISNTFTYLRQCADSTSETSTLDAVVVQNKHNEFGYMKPIMRT